MSEPAKLQSLDARFEVGELLGEGGMGAVHLAWDRVLEREVALKFIRGADPSLAERLLLEARLQARVEHANIGKVYEVGEHQGRPCIALQLIRGKSLEQLAPALGLNERVRLLRQVAEGVHAAHLTGLVHRDIKPANLLVEIDGESRKAYVTDFGLARGPASSGLSQNGIPAGTLSFMSPEQAAADGPVDFRSDLYSLGASLYSLLVFRPPFAGKREGKEETPQDTDSMAGFYGLFGSTGEAAQVGLLRRVIEDEPPPPRSIDRRVPRDLETIALRCLHKNPGSRYPSALALADDLGRYLEGKSIVARPPGWIERSARWVLRHRAAVLGAAAVLIVAAAAFAFNARNSARAAALQVERDAIMQRFDQTMLDAIYRLRLAHMAPLHDRRPQVEALRASINSVSADMSRLGPIAAGPGHSAVGLGLLALDDYKGAIEHLEQAWSLGVRSPESAEALGWALYQMQAQETNHLFSAPPGEMKERKAKIESIKSRALAVLATFERKGETPFSAPLRAQIRGETQEAIAGLRAVIAAEPWHQRALLLLVKIRARISSHARSPEDLQRALAEADAAVEQLIQIAPSDPGSWHEAWLLRYTESLRETGSVKRQRELLLLGVAAARNATLADSHSARPLNDLTQALQTLAAQNLELGISPLAEIAEGLEANRRSLEFITPEQRGLLPAIDIIFHVLRASWELEHGESADADLRALADDRQDLARYDATDTWGSQTAGFELELAGAFLLAGKPPGALLDLAAADLQRYTKTHGDDGAEDVLAESEALLGLLAEDGGDPSAALYAKAKKHLALTNPEEGAAVRTDLLLELNEARAVLAAHDKSHSAREDFAAALAGKLAKAPGDPFLRYLDKRGRELHLLGAKK